MDHVAKTLYKFLFNLSHAKSQLQIEAIHASIDDIAIMTPDYAICTIPQPSPEIDPCAQVGILRCPKWDRTFLQAGSWKCHMRTHHGIPCNIEDLFDVFRNVINGYPICAHCTKSFTDIYHL